MIYSYLRELFMALGEKMNLDIAATLRALAQSESKSKILARSEKHQRQYALRAFNAKQKQIPQKIFNTRTKNK